jgi:hypothetical protein
MDTGDTGIATRLVNGSSSMAHLAPDGNGYISMLVDDPASIALAEVVFHPPARSLPNHDPTGLQLGYAGRVPADGMYVRVICLYSVMVGARNQAHFRCC